MKIHRFIGKFDLSQKEITLKDPENTRQVRDVLKLKTGEQMILCDGAGLEALVKIVDISKKEIICVVENIEKHKDTERSVHLYLAILKKENFELAVQKAVECGATSITPIITERTIKTGLNTERLEKIIKEASEQSGRNFLPHLSPTLNFKDAIKQENSDTEKIIFHTSQNEAENETQIKAKNINLFIGPEGGFTDAEVSLAKESGARVSSLGPLTLRAETAAIVATFTAVNKI
jgi:16S rRNA (uracil1498-N3)-methyltransferase